MAGEAPATQARAHVLAIPMPFYGHIVPTIQVCSALACHGFCTTLVLTEGKAARAAKALQSRPSRIQAMIRITSVSVDGEPASLLSSWDTAREATLCYHRNFPLAVRPLIDDLLMNIAMSKNDHDANMSMMSRPPPLACVMSDAYLSWTQDVARELGVPRVSLWCSSAAEFQVYLHAGKLLDSGLLPFKAPSGRTSPEDIDPLVPGIPGKGPVYHRHYDDDDDDDAAAAKAKIAIPGLPSLERGEFPTFLQIEDANDPLFFGLTDPMRQALEADMILFNSFTELEGTVLKAVTDEHADAAAYSIGPLFLLDQELVVNDRKDGRSAAALIADTNAETIINENDADVLRWLDKHAPKSVMYVSFGSAVPLSDPQIEELALGLQASQQPFLWALRVPSLDLIKESLDQERGLVVEWAPQSDVLAHPSVGAYLSHCGWGSTLESISMGVPMLAYPIWADSPLVSRLLEELCIAIKLPKSSRAEGIAKADDVAKLTREMLLGDRGRQCRDRAGEFSEHIKKTVKMGGSSRATLGVVVEKLLSFAAAV